MRGWFLFLLLSWSILGRSQTFNEAYDLIPTGGDLGVGIVVGHDSSLIVGVKTGSRLILLSVDSDSGSVQWNKSVFFPGFGLDLGRSGGLIKTQNGYAGTGGFFDGVTYEVLFVRWNAQGDTVLTRHFSTGHNCRGITLHQIHPNKYLIIGDREATSSSAARITVWAVDSLGNLLWEENVNTGVGQEEVRNTVELSDGNIFISAFTGIHKSHALVMDTAGNVIWDKLYNDYFVMYCNEADTGLVCLNYAGTGTPQPYLQHMSFDGELGDGFLLNQQYQRGSSGHDPFLDENGDVYGIGSQISIGNTGYMRKIRQDGTVVWERTYTKGTGTHYVWDATPTPDGGYAFTGSTNLNSQAVWVVKVDRDGCEVPLCNISLEEYDEAELKFYPNPTQNRVTIELRELGSGTLYLYDVFGVLQKSEDVTTERPIVFWELEGLAKGQYIVVYEATSGIRAHAKLIVQ
jgi:hypothetical protein